MKAYVDRQTCIGCQTCAGICPEVFNMDDENKSVPITGEVPEEYVEDTKQAEESCPVDAISTK